MEAADQKRILQNLRVKGFAPPNPKPKKKPAKQKKGD